MISPMIIGYHLWYHSQSRHQHNFASKWFQYEHTALCRRAQLGRGEERKAADWSLELGSLGWRVPYARPADGKVSTVKVTTPDRCRPAQARWAQHHPRRPTAQAPCLSPASKPWAPASAGMTDRDLAWSRFRRNLDHITIKGYWVLNLAIQFLLIAIGFFFGVQFISEFECRECSFVLLPDRPTRLIGHTRCF